MKAESHPEAKRGLNLLHVADNHASAEQGLVCTISIAWLRKQHKISAPLGQLAEGLILSPKLCRDRGLLQSAVMPCAGTIALRHLSQMWSDRMLISNSITFPPKRCKNMYCLESVAVDGDDAV